MQTGTSKESNTGNEKKEIRIWCWNNPGGDAATDDRILPMIRTKNNSMTPEERVASSTIHMENYGVDPKDAVLCLQNFGYEQGGNVDLHAIDGEAYWRNWTRRFIEEWDRLGLAAPKAVYLDCEKKPEGREVREEKLYSAFYRPVVSAWGATRVGNYGGYYITDARVSRMPVQYADPNVEDERNLASLNECVGDWHTVPWIARPGFLYRRTNTYSTANDVYKVMSRCIEMTDCNWFMAWGDDYQQTDKHWYEFIKVVDRL